MWENYRSFELNLNKNVQSKNIFKIPFKKNPLKQASFIFYVKILNIHNICTKLTY